MRWSMACLFTLLLVAAGLAQVLRLDTRYNIGVDRPNYAQDTPKATLAAVIKAIETKKYDYLMAHLVDPAFVDPRVKKDHAGKFEALVKETGDKLHEDPDVLKVLRRFVKDGEWETAEDSASVQLKDVSDRVYFKKKEDRWFMENRREASK